MGRDSAIEWCDHTINLWWGCTKVKEHRGCDYCYAHDLDKRYGGNHWGDRMLRRQIISAFSELDKIQKNAAIMGKNHKVFIGSMMDIFEKPKATDREDDTKTLRDKLFNKITEDEYPNIIFQFLTKRPENIPYYIPSSWYTNCPPNLWFGTSVSTQFDDHALDQLCRLAPTQAHRFVSVEPLLSYVSLAYYMPDEIQWVIVGGESGRHARPMHPDWPLLLRDECEAFGVPFFFKQWGEYAPVREGSKIDVIFDDRGNHNPLNAINIARMTRFGKKAAGRELDGHIYSQFPLAMEQAYA